MHAPTHTHIDIHTDMGHIKSITELFGWIKTFFQRMSTYQWNKYKIIIKNQNFVCFDPPKIQACDTFCNMVYILSSWGRFLFLPLYSRGLMLEKHIIKSTGQRAHHKKKFICNSQNIPQDVARGPYNRSVVTWRGDNLKKAQLPKSRHSVFWHLLLPSCA